MKERIFEDAKPPQHWDQGEESKPWRAGQWMGRSPAVDTLNSLPSVGRQRGLDPWALGG